MTARARWRRMVGWLAVAGLACSLWAANLVICPKCGWETDGNAAVCLHCGAAMPVVKVEPAVPPPAAATGGVPTVAFQQFPAVVSDLALKAARADRQHADECLTNGLPAVAYAYYGNALALSRLVRREGLSASAGQSLIDGLAQSRQQLIYTPRTCTTCGGTGARTIRVQTLAGDKSPAATMPLPFSDSTVCLTCSGRGVVTTSRLANEMRVLIAQGAREFELREQADGRVTSGRVWLSPELLVLLNVRAQVLLRTGRPTPCASCMGLGQQDCNRCKGAGRIKCTGVGCVNGQITVADNNAMSAVNNKKPLTHKEVCPICQGSSLMACPDCLSVGTVPCKKCDGTGRNAICPECGGQGWEPCQKCQGTGQLGKVVCPVCQGEKVVFCPKCHGEGCSAR